MDKKIIVGSRAFFSQYEDFEPSDKDYVEFSDDQQEYFWVEKKDDEHIFHYKTTTKEEFINFELEHADVFPMAATKFLVPEILEYFDMTFDDLYLFNRNFENIDRRHKYTKVIYNAYLENGSFTLTEEQRLAAYNEYKSIKK